MGSSRKNPNQTQLHQNPHFDERLKGETFHQFDKMFVFFRVIPGKESGKLLQARRRPFVVNIVIQEGH